ncbi:hypothetical protein AVEN_221765-1 [Araneus ventricosus]|uniref:MATH domain-containing protein n=1 Tax=Araneus ventricosus TaxID=182803 RepID=A0A4Y2FSP9_ARAVE|nr:hypothetical protein AVEN_221765-1 [Araneus ventricosus]
MCGPSLTPGNYYFQTQSATDLGPASASRNSVIRIRIRLLSPHGKRNVKVCRKAGENNRADKMPERGERDSWPGNFEIDFEFSFIEGDKSTPLAEQKGKSQFQKLGSPRCGAIFNSNLIGEVLVLSNHTLTVRCRLWRTGSDVSQSDLCFARTRVEVEQHSFVWAIKRFSSLRPGQNRTMFLHPTFERLPTLILTFNLQEKDGKEYVYISVHRNPVTGAHWMNIQVSLLDCEGCFVPATHKEISPWITPEREKV